MNKEIEEEDKGKVAIWLDKYIENHIGTNSQYIKGYVAKLREQNPNITDKKLARKIKNRKSFKNGLVGAATGVGGILTLPITIPVDLIASWKIQIGLAFAIAHVYGHSHNTADLKTDIYIILAGNSAKEALKTAGIQITKEITKKAIQKNITKEVMKKIWQKVPQKIITKSGEKSLTSFTKMVPLLGAPIGFGFDYISTQILGSFAIKYYSGK
ncbi:EcsC family protein [Lutibacter citreus]|uniref:EcsC family protein n=1 Tax=Lutibacter citreus TaxID=2138210 RepID=UPI000DBE7152|nr:EcsC family protein [Lutibacter citreus]